jgi:hypothetical protein
MPPDPKCAFDCKFCKERKRWVNGKGKKKGKEEENKDLPPKRIPRQIELTGSFKNDPSPENLEKVVLAQWRHYLDTWLELNIVQAASILPRVLKSIDLPQGRGGIATHVRLILWDYGILFRKEVAYMAVHWQGVELEDGKLANPYRSETGELLDETLQSLDKHCQEILDRFNSRKFTIPEKI